MNKNLWSSLLNFFSTDVKMTALQFGNMQKMDGPTEHCEDSTSIPTYNCSDNLVRIFWLSFYFSFKFICSLLQLHTGQQEKPTHGNNLKRAIRFHYIIITQNNNTTPPSFFLFTETCLIFSSKGWHMRENIDQLCICRM